MVVGKEERRTPSVGSDTAMIDAGGVGVEAGVEVQAMEHINAGGGVPRLVDLQEQKIDMRLMLRTHVARRSAADKARSGDHLD